ncbi:MAG: cobalt-precorrin-5B (C(1))-methyltransferase CbiD [Candidatus Limivivens sp.]|nr:cobalt-precorrin-5B (C(1))-methyltransferase CbiD [Candidatus Limivivens sp.]
METGLENYFIIKDNKKMRYGYTTGSCAAAAAGAAARMLLGGKKQEYARLMTPRGILLTLEILDAQFDEKTASCAVRKDGGDDPDATHGLLVCARAEKAEGTGIVIDGGRGVGRVTKKGLEQPVGAAAINQVPRAMIEREVRDACEEMEYGGGLRIVISIPGGEEVAKKTFNPRLGIEGGLSVLGTSGIVVPMSEDALIASIRTEMKMRRENGAEYLLVTPGNYGRDFLKNKETIRVEESMKCSNYVGETLDAAVNLGIRGILFVAHIGKFIKVSGGIMNTHSRCADSRAELFCAHAIRAGADRDLAKRLLDTITTEEAVDILKEEGMLEPVMEQIVSKVGYYLQHRCGQALQTEAILFSNNHGWLGQTEGAEELLKKFVTIDTDELPYK